MSPRDFLHNSASDVAIRSRGFWPYFLVYGGVFIAAYAINASTPFPIPLMAHTQRAASASAWAFIISYPLFHLLMKPRILQSYDKPIRKIFGWVLGASIVGFFVFFLRFQLPESPVTRTGRALLSPVLATAFLAAVSTTVSLGLFLLLEPVRRRLSRGL